VTIWWVRSYCNSVRGRAQLKDKVHTASVLEVWEWRQKGGEVGGRREAKGRQNGGRKERAWYELAIFVARKMQLTRTTDVMSKAVVEVVERKADTVSCTEATAIDIAMTARLGTAQLSSGRGLSCDCLFCKAKEENIQENMDCPWDFMAMSTIMIRRL